MPILAAFGLCFQIFFAVHAVRSGCDRYWLYIIIFFPGIGCLIYFFAEYLPSLQQSYRLQRLKSDIGHGLNPGKRLRYLQMQVERTPSVKNKKLLAEAYVNERLFDPAIALYGECLQGAYRQDRHLLEGLSCAYFFKGDYRNAKTNLTQLSQNAPEHGSDPFQLLLARTHEALGELEAAKAAYSGMLKRFSGEEARCRYALLLKQSGQVEEARRLFQEILNNVRLSPRYYRKAQKPWVEIAKKEIA
jgi:hypothetical protein